MKLVSSWIFFWDLFFECLIFFFFELIFSHGDVLWWLGCGTPPSMWSTSQERPSRIPYAGGPSGSRPWTWPPGQTCQTCHEFVAAAPVHLATCFGSGRGAATQGGSYLRGEGVRKTEENLFVLGGTLGFFGYTTIFFEMMDGIASCWILPAWIETNLII